MLVHLSGKHRSQPVAVCRAALAVAAASLLAVVIVSQGRPRRSEHRLHLKTLQQKMAAVESAVRCPFEQRQLQLGEVTSWASDRSPDGAPRLCAVCTCQLNTLNDENASLSCTIHDCPFLGCTAQLRSHGAPQHQCCHVCPAPREASTESPKLIVKSSPTMDPRVPVTRDIYNGVFRHLPADLCTSVSPLAVVAVTSLPAAAGRRAQFRRLYGSAVAAADMRLIFFMGVDEPVARAFNDFTDDLDLLDDETGADGEVDLSDGAETSADAERLRRATQDAVDAEVRQYGDIVQSTVPEHYFHLALKTVSLLDAFGRVCPGAKFLVKTDDDVLINVPLLAAEAAALPAGRVVHGRLADSLRPDRPGLAWEGYISSQREWPAETYPPLVLGNGYLVSAEATVPLLRTALATRYHHLEDVFVTGIAAQAAGVERRRWRQHCMFKGGAGPPSVCDVSRCALTHRVKYDAHADRLEAILYATRRFSMETLCPRNGTRVF